MRMEERVEDEIQQEDRTTSKKKFHFEKLTPYNESELYVYEAAINKIFEDKDIKNVAISGSYGAGKSSLIETYKKKYPERKFLHISLAHFNQFDDTDEQEISESIIEGKILNQLLHQIEPTNIPQTIFKVKSELNLKNIICRSIFILFTILAAFYLISPFKWNSYLITLYPMKLIDKSVYNYLPFLIGIIFSIMLLVIVYQLVRMINIKNIFKRINVQGNEVELFDTAEELFFDKYLSEVLYLFENAGVDCILFEDIDRFETTRIFERLYEISILVNRKISIKFLYLIRDDIFTSKDRTKFFDLIIPVIPVIDSSNSYEKFIEYFNVEEYTSLDKNFLQRVSLYVDEMRILKNIYNEFVIYYNVLNKTELDSNKMLAIIIYKNLFPRDFSDLQLKRGFVYHLMNCREIIIESEVKLIEEEIKEKEKEIQQIENEIVKTENEFSIIRDELKRNANSIAALNKIDEDIDRRIQLFKAKKDNPKNVIMLRQQINRHRDEIKNISKKNMKELITRENIDKIFELPVSAGISRKVETNEYFGLLKYLIRNGYINESYTDYMTYFYENSISQRDKIFLRSIMDKKKKENNFKLDDPNLILEKLNLEDFDQIEVLNYDLLEYLLTEKGNSLFLGKLIVQLARTQNFKFIIEFINNSTDKDEIIIDNFIGNLNNLWNNNFYQAIENNLTSEQLRILSIYSIYYSREHEYENDEIEDDLDDLNTEGYLTEFISNDSEFLNIENPKMDKLIVGLNKLEVKFINIEGNNNNLIKEVYQNSLYQININNLKYILKNYYNINDEKDIKEKNYTLINSDPSSPLLDYIEENIGIYLEIMIDSRNGGTIRDDEIMVLKLLNNEGIDMDRKKSYINLLSTKISLISDVTNPNLWSSLLERHIIMYSEENILLYCVESVVDKTDGLFIEFINSNEMVLNFSKLKEYYDSELFDEFFNYIILQNNLSNKKYEEILKTLDCDLDKFNIINISDEKIEILIKIKILIMNPENLIFMRENYLPQVELFIYENTKEYLEVLTNNLIDLDELMKILNGNFSDDFKKEIISFINLPISIQNDNYSNSLKLAILRDNLNKDDLTYLFENYHEMDTKIQEIILQFAVRYIDILNSNIVRNSIDLMDSLFKLEDIDVEFKINLLIGLLPYISKEKGNFYLNLSGINEFDGILNGMPNQIIKSTTINEQILEIFKINEWIAEYNVDKNNNYRIKKIENKNLEPNLSS